MKYLHAIFHNISHPFHSIRRLLIVSVLVSVTLIITGSVPQLMIVHKLIGPILQFSFFVCGLNIPGYSTELCNGDRWSFEQEATVQISSKEQSSAAISSN